MSLATPMRMARKHGSSSLRFSRLQAWKKMLLVTAEAMGSTSPEKVLKNFVDLLQNASPQLKFAILLLTPWAMLFTAMSKYTLLRQGLSTLKKYARNTIYASVSIPGSHPLNKQLLQFMVEQQGLGKNARTLALSPPAGTNPLGTRGILSMYDDYPYTYDLGGRRVKNKRNPNAEEEDRQRQALSFIPEVGSYTFWWKWYPMTFERQRNLQEQVDSKGRVSYISTLSGNEPIVISCPSFIAGTRPIQQFLQHVKTMPAKDNTTTIYRPDGANSTWDAGITRPSRNLNAVTLDAHVKDDLVKDIEIYLAPETRKYYANRGIPWRRGFLFYGNPGTGKTSFSNALAGHLGLNIYVLSLSNATLTDTMLETLFEQLPSKCIVLLEDIDSAGIQREEMRKELAKATRKSSKYHPQYYDENGNPITPEMFVRRMGGVTLSGLLNVLDGINSKEGHVTIMTSNSPDSLDPALVRPGRIDRKVLFGYASSEVIRKLFVHIFSKAPEEQLEADKGEECQHDIPLLAEKFADIVPPNKLTPAEVQGYLLVHREDPVEAVTEAEAWVQKTIDTKEKGANVEAFAGQESSQTKDGKREAKSKKKPKKARTADSTKAAAPNGAVDNDSEDEDEEETSSDQTTSSPDDDNTSESTTPTSTRSSVANTPAQDPPVYTPTTHSTAISSTLLPQMASPFSAQNPSTTQHPQNSLPTLHNNANSAALQALSQQFFQAGGFGIVVPSMTPVPVGPTVGQPANDVASSAAGVKKKTKARSKRK